MHNYKITRKFPLFLVAGLLGCAPTTGAIDDDVTGRDLASNDQTEGKEDGFFDWFRNQATARAFEASREMEVRITGLGAQELYDALAITPRYVSNTCFNCSNSYYVKQVSEVPLIECREELTRSTHVDTVCDLNGVFEADTDAAILEVPDAASVLLRGAMADVSGGSAWTSGSGTVEINCAGDNCEVNVTAFDEYWIDRNNIFFGHDDREVRITLNDADAIALFDAMSATASTGNYPTKRLYVRANGFSVYCSKPVAAVSRDPICFVDVPLSRGDLQGGALPYPVSIGKVYIADAAAGLFNGLVGDGASRSFATPDGVLSIECLQDGNDPMCSVSIERPQP